MMKLNHYMAYLQVAVESHEAGRISGLVYSQRLTAPIQFSDTADLLLQIEDLLDEQDFPRAFQRKRTFAKRPQKPVPSGGADRVTAAADVGDVVDVDEGQPMDGETVNQARGAVATFAMNVITRQNTSWQGYLDWLDGSARKAFNSELELIAMIEEGLTGHK